ncbi:hypothetical protein Ahy_A04g019226 [Arachis hypogaea]|uniref:Uncharacterized protein n=1 Tax=Arachis hypogaea TaxID=3818 RepID=A0A445DFK8_ARAHY|nr:hypothetical protein Ahy_A04g019226 [Arachis hypogaea]
MVEMDELKAKRKGTSSLSHEDANLESVNELQSPPRIRTRGRPKNRLESIWQYGLNNNDDGLDSLIALLPRMNPGSIFYSKVVHLVLQLKGILCLMNHPTITTNGPNGKQDEAHGRDNLEKMPKSIYINQHCTSICVSAASDARWTFDKMYLSWTWSVHTVSNSLFWGFWSFSLPLSCVDAPSCVAASSWLELVKPRLNDGNGSALGTYDAVRAIIISAAASSGAGLLRDHIELGEAWVCFLQVVGGVQESCTFLQFVAEGLVHFLSQMKVNYHQDKEAAINCLFLFHLVICYALDDKTQNMSSPILLCYCVHLENWGQERHLYIEDENPLEHKVILFIINGNSHHLICQIFEGLTLESSKNLFVIFRKILIIDFLRK